MAVPGVDGEWGAQAQGRVAMRAYVRMGAGRRRWGVVHGQLGPHTSTHVTSRLLTLTLRRDPFLRPQSGQLSVLSLKRCGLQPHDELQVSEVLRAKRDKLIEEEVAGPV